MKKSQVCKSFPTTRLGVQEYTNYVMLHVLDADTRSALMEDDMEPSELLQELFMENRFTDHSDMAVDTLMNISVEVYGVSGIMNIINGYNRATYQGQSISETDEEIINELALAIAYGMVTHMNNHDIMLSWGYREYVLLESRERRIDYIKLRESCIGLCMVMGGDQEDVDELLENDEDMMLLGYYANFPDMMEELQYQGLTVDHITKNHVGPYSKYNVYDVSEGDKPVYALVVG